MFNESTLFSYPQLKTVLEGTVKQGTLLEKITNAFNLDKNILSGRQKISIELLSEIFIFCDDHGETSVAFNYGLLSESGSLGLLDYYLASCNTLHQALSELIKYFPLIAFTETNIIKNYTSNNNARISLVLDPNTSRKKQLLLEFTIATITSLIIRLNNHCWPMTIEFPYPALSKNIYDVLSKNGVQINLNSDSYSILLKQQQEIFQLLFSNPRTAALLKPELDQMLQEKQQSNSIVFEIFSLFSLEKDIGLISQTEIAEHLNTSESSLKRKLFDAGTSFSQILSSFKREKSLLLLNKNSFTTEQISKRLGYGDRTSFERAFKLWTNLSPSQYMQQLQLAQISLESIKTTDINSLPSSPKICQQILELTQSDNYDIPTLSKVIQTDPVLTGKLMGIANSAYYGGNNVTDINQAIIQVLGIGIVQNLVISMMCCKQLEIKNCPEFNIGEFWLQALATAEAVKQFCRLPQVKKIAASDELYLAALLHNIGRYSLVFLRPKEMNTFLGVENKEHYNPTDILDNTTHNKQLQVQIFGLSAAAIGALVLTHWGLPKNVCTLIRELDTETSEQSKSVRLLQLLSSFVEYKIRQPELEEMPNIIVKQLAELIDADTSQVDQILTKLLSQFDQINAISKEI